MSTFPSLGEISHCRELHQAAPFIFNQNITEHKNHIQKLFPEENLKCNIAFPGAVHSMHGACSIVYKKKYSESLQTNL